MKTCECGCGAEVTRRFAHGHNRRLRQMYTVATNGCWIWTGAPNSHGYAQIKRDGQHYRAHRWMYERLVGVVPNGLMLDHLCRNKMCVNPSHLEPVTNAVNTQRGDVARLTPEAVRVIRSNPGRSSADLAEEFAVSRDSIVKVRRGVIWKGITPHTEEVSAA